MSKENKKQELIQEINKYVENSIFDISKFRLEKPKLYATLPYYFGSIDKMLAQLGLVKIQKSQSKNKVTLRNRLAYDYLKQLRENYTLEQISKKYDCSRSLINQQYQALELTIKIEELQNKGNSSNILERLQNGEMSIDNREQ